MDIDVMGKHIHSLLAFKEMVEGMMKGADGNVEKASETLDRLVGFAAAVEATMPEISKAVSDVSIVVADVEAIKKDLGPALEWIAARQKADEEAKAAAASAAA